MFDDADQENALNGITAGIFGASGQSCIAGSRLYLQSKIYNEFLDKLITKAKKIKLGGPMEEDTQMVCIKLLKPRKVSQYKVKIKHLLQPLTKIISDCMKNYLV